MTKRAMCLKEMKRMVYSDPGAWRVLRRVLYISAAISEEGDTLRYRELYTQSLVWHIACRYSSVLQL